MGERDFTNVRIRDDVMSFEGKFTHIENLAAPIVAQIIGMRSLTALDAMEQATLHMFVVAQFLRSKRRRIDQAAIGREIKRRWPEAEINPAKDEMIDEEFEKFSSLEFAFSHLRDFTAILVPKHSYLLVKDCPGELYISDNPMVMHNNRDYGPYGNIGLAVPHIEIYYPLSQEIVLAYMCPLTAKETEEAHREAEKEIDSLVSRMFMSPQGLSAANRLQIEQSRAEVQRAKDYWALIKNERLAPINSETLLFLNSLQMLSSFRYLACRSDDFGFAIKALSERPHWKEGIGVKVS
jgi:hypothetical protein